MQNINEELSDRNQTITNQTMYEKIELIQKYRIVDITCKNVNEK